MDAWGFEYKTLAWEWVKLNKSGVGWHLGMGYYTRANPEPCLLAVRGKMPVAVRDQRNLIVSYEDECGPLTGLPMAGFLNDCLELPMIEPIGKHSRKPDAQYRKIESLYPSGRYIELFARRPVDGWDVLGNEIDGRDIRQSLTTEAHR
jgi:N6-adenosine-specific RNA methylase IME4